MKADLSIELSKENEAGEGNLYLLSELLISKGSSFGPSTVPKRGSFDSFDSPSSPSIENYRAAAPRSATTWPASRSVCYWRASSMSCSTIMRTSSVHETRGFHPSCAFAFEGSPLRKSTSVARKYFGSTSTQSIDSRPAVRNLSATNFLNQRESLVTPPS